MRQRLKAAFILLVAIFAATPTFASEQVIEHFSLKNGMEVYILPNHRVEAVNHTLWFKVGSADDPPGKSGLAHFHEHMMFQGTPSHGKGEYSQIIARNGGRENAFTSYDTTGYYVSIAKEQLPLVMELEADRITNLNPTKEDALKEREVIIEERRSRTENNPSALLEEQLDAALFLNHPYRLPVIGWKHEMEGLTLEDVMQFHRRYTQAGNAILILTGDITAAEAKPLVEKYYNDLPSGEKPDRHWKNEPPQISERRVTMRHPNVKQPSWARQFMTPSMAGNPQQAPALMVLSYVLGGSNTSRLYQQLVVRDKIATNVSSGYNGFALGPSPFVVHAVPAPNIRMEELAAAIEKEIVRIGKKGVKPDELARAKTLLKADAVFSREGLQQMGQVLGWVLMSGLPAGTLTQWEKMIDAVTAKQVIEAAHAALRNDASVEGWLLPESEARP